MDAPERDTSVIGLLKSGCGTLASAIEDRDWLMVDEAMQDFCDATEKVQLFIDTGRRRFSERN